MAETLAGAFKDSVETNATEDSDVHEIFLKIKNYRLTVKMFIFL
jgi:hypothetical protein